MKPFSYYKKNIDSILENSYTDKQLFKENFHVIMGALKLSKPFREFFTLYNDVESRNFKNKSELTEYINESVMYLRPKINSLKQVCNILEVVFGKRKKLIKESKNNIYGGLDYLIYKKGVKNITNKIEVKNKLVESILDRKSTNRLSTKLSPKTLAYSLSENYNKEFSKLSKDDKKVLSEVLSIKPKVLKEEVNKIKESILNKINTLVKESKEENLKAKLTQTKNVVIKMKTDKLSLLKLKQLATDLN
jgi:hypothetical protein|tara:strand:- start:1828 stop:2571 length:744 start_codon:yes stop_codon:yes gene_type:complete